VNNTTTLSAPPGLSEHSTNMFFMLSNQLINDGLLYTVDIPQLEMLITNIDKWWKLYKRQMDLIKIENLQIEEIKEFCTLERTLNTLHKTIRQSLNDFGFNPSARKALMVELREDTIDITDGLVDD